MKGLLLLVSLFTFIFSNPLYLIQNSSRFDKIYLPNFNYTQFGEVYSYNAFSAPISVCPLKFSQELCQKAKLELQSHDSTFWNSTNISDPCRSYFCKESQRYNSSLLHFSAHRYCLNCIDTINENLTLAENCSNINYEICKQCSKESACIYYDQNFPLCYHYKTNTFLWKDDFTHLYLIPFLLNIYPFILVVVSLIMCLLYLFLIIIPTIIMLIKQLKGKDDSFFDKIKNVFNLQNQAKLTFFLSNLIFFVASFIDIISYYVDGSQFILFIALAAYIVAAVLIIGLISLIIYWTHLIKLMDDLNIYGSPSCRYITLYILALFSFGIMGLCCGLSFLLYRFVDKSKRGVWIHMLGGFVCFIIIVSLIILFALIILSIRILIILNKIKVDDSNILEVAIKQKV